MHDRLQMFSPKQAMQYAYAYYTDAIINVRCTLCMHCAYKSFGVYAYSTTQLRQCLSLQVHPLPPMQYKHAVISTQLRQLMKSMYVHCA